MSEPYLILLKHVLSEGEVRTDRTGVGTISLFGPQIRFDLRDGFPIITTKKINFSSVVHELLWFLSGSTNVNDLNKNTKIWDEWADPVTGSLGPIYGHQWRSWGADEGSKPGEHGVDQIKQVIHQIKNTPDSRRLIVSAWNVSDIPKMRLSACHVLFQFYVSGKFLDCKLYQRSADLALGVPFNIASYALLQSMIAKECNLTPRYFIHTFGDAHIYLNHVEGIKEQLTRSPIEYPQLEISDKPVLSQTFEDIKLINYRFHPSIKFQVAV